MIEYKDSDKTKLPLTEKHLLETFTGLVILANTTTSERYKNNYIEAAVKIGENLQKSGHIIPEETLINKEHMLQTFRGLAKLVRATENLEDEKLYVDATVQVGETYEGYGYVFSKKLKQTFLEMWDLGVTLAAETRDRIR